MSATVRTALVGSFLLLAACEEGLPTQEPGPDGASQLAQDLAYFSKLYEGEYSDIETVLASGGAVGQRHFTYRTIDRPDFGEHVVYVEQAYGAGGDPDMVYRQRIYSSYADEKRNEIVTRIYNFPPDTAMGVRGAQFDPSLLKKFSPRNMTVLPDGCEIFWRRKGDEIIGYQKPGVCKMLIPNTDTMMLLADDLVLNDSLFSTFTRATDLEGNALFGDEKPTVMRRASVYRCALSLTKAGTAIAAARLHDQGGTVMAEGAGADGKNLFVRLRRQEPASAASTLILDILSAEEEVLETATSTPDKATFFTGNVSAQCSLNPAPWQG